MKRRSRDIKGLHILHLLLCRTLLFYSSPTYTSLCHGPSYWPSATTTTSINRGTSDPEFELGRVVDLGVPYTVSLPYRDGRFPDTGSPSSLFMDKRVLRSVSVLFTISTCCLTTPKSLRPFNHYLSWWQITQGGVTQVTQVVVTTFSG